MGNIAENRPPLEEESWKRLEPLGREFLPFSQPIYPMRYIPDDVWQQLGVPIVRNRYDNDGPIAYQFDPDRKFFLFRFDDGVRFADFSMTVTPLDVLIFSLGMADVHPQKYSDRAPGAFFPVRLSTICSLENGDDM